LKVVFIFGSGTTDPWRSDARTASRAFAAPGGTGHPAVPPASDEIAGSNQARG
jgi:hypothetical protein